jgi:Holliday junction resolvase
MHTYEAFSILDKVNSTFGPSEFGRISQILLGFSFLRSGYDVPTMQLSGRPDIVATNRKSSYILEVKTSNSSVIPLKKEDIQGTNGVQGSTPIIAVLSYPEIEIEWTFADASKLRSSVYNKSALKLFSISGLESEINQQFFAVLEKFQTLMMLGTNILLQTFREEQKRALHNR